MSNIVLQFYSVFKQHSLEVFVAALLVAFVSWLLPSFMRRWRVYRAVRSIPCVPEQHFLFGHAPEMVKDMAAGIVKFTNVAISNRWKMIKVCYGPMMNQILCTHPDTIRLIYKSDPKSDEVYYPMLPWLDRGLLTANGKRWERSRRLLTPAFHYDILRPYVKVYAEAVGETIDLWKKVPEGESVDVFPYISLLTLDVMLRCSCSFKSNCQITKSHSPYISAVYQLTKLSNKRIMSAHQYFDFIYFFCPDRWKFKHYCDVVHKFSMETIQTRRAHLEKAKKAGHQEVPKKKYLDFIDILLEAKDGNGVGMTDLEIRAEVDTFLFEGHDTTASGLTWTLYNLAKHPEHQEKCRREVDAIFEKKDEITSEDLKSLVHLKYCIKESIRLFPPVPNTGRVLAAATEIDGRVLPEGTPVVGNIYGVHHHPDFWDNPEDFDPLRFTIERSKGRHSHAFVPFSAGPRNCIGQEFALNEEKVLLAHILRNFELSLDESKLPVEMDYLLILRPKHGLHLKFKSREI